MNWIYPKRHSFKYTSRWPGSRTLLYRSHEACKLYPNLTSFIRVEPKWMIFHIMVFGYVGTSLKYSKDIWGQGYASWNDNCCVESLHELPWVTQAELHCFYCIDFIALICWRMFGQYIFNLIKWNSRWSGNPYIALSSFSHFLPQENLTAKLARLETPNFAGMICEQPLNIYPLYLGSPGIWKRGDLKREDKAGSPEVIASQHWLGSFSTGENLVLERSFTQDADQPCRPLLLKASKAQVQDPQPSLGDCSAGLHCCHPCIGRGKGDQQQETCSRPPC